MSKNIVTSKNKSFSAFYRGRKRKRIAGELLEGGLDLRLLREPSLSLNAFVLRILAGRFLHRFLGSFLSCTLGRIRLFAHGDFLTGKRLEVPRGLWDGVCVSFNFRAAALVYQVV